jgi:ribosomal protein L21E
MFSLSHPQRPEMLIELTQASQEHEKIATSRFLLVYEARDKVCVSMEPSAHE